MLPAGPLMIEHRLIERMINVMKKHGEAIAGGAIPNHGLLDQVIDFLRVYADECHHGKEEDLLFTALRSKPMGADMVAAMDRLIEDHVHARTLVARLDQLNARGEKGEGATSKEIAEVLAELAALYPDHIRREDREFFPQAMKYLQRDEADRMLEAFKEFDRKLIHRKYLTVVEGAEGQ